MKKKLCCHKKKYRWTNRKQNILIANIDVANLLRMIDVVNLLRMIDVANLLRMIDVVNILCIIVCPDTPCLK
jgi:hypothetical protein